MEYRIEKDTMGEVKVPIDAYYGAQTQRSIDNFKIAEDINRMPKEIIRAFAYLKHAAAITNLEAGVLAKPPWNRPIAVRAPLTMTTSSMVSLLMLLTTKLCGHGLFLLYCALALTYRPGAGSISLYLSPPRRSRAAIMVPPWGASH